ncbi:cation:proton antiporter domain-containing protein [Oceanospirillum sediminis]|uniref:Cation:proton antiporter n=1 Tax=Oceanospirillum sediminis TaxID=2760088 RepID=A0A839ITQ9_9GAMM|nr:cation:proton antiporter [Oceanospirillum sediminis]MBB1487869.1 cation:proton antiporter [Oceanospirillum sediminis]
MPNIVGITLLILIVALVLKILKQPHVIAYLIAGITLGPWGIGLVNDADLMNRLGAMGVVLLLFFVGMETDARQLARNWRLALIGTGLQIVSSFVLVFVLGHFLTWPFERILLIAFVISLSSTAVVIQLLQDKGLMGSRIGQGALSILLAQDLALIPMLIVLGVLGAGEVSDYTIIKQSLGTLLAIALFTFLVKARQVHLPLGQWLKGDKELQVFAALGVCSGFALISGWFELSTALGAFLAGMLIGAAKETQWVHHTLESLKVVFVALFFVSVGLLLNLEFLTHNLLVVLALVVLALMAKTLINTLILKGAAYSWRESVLTGALLSQIGEFSFVLAAVGFQAEMISDFGYQLALSVISLTLLVSPLWIGITEKIVKESD